MQLHFYSFYGHAQYYLQQLVRNFYFAKLVEGIRSTSRILYCFASHASSNHSLLILLPLLYAAFPRLGALAD